MTAGRRGRKGARRAFVTGSDFAFGMARMYQTLADDLPSEIRVFDDMSEALEWLDLDELGSHH